MTDSADPRIALMQKWSQENPELLAQAGLASSFENKTHLDAFATVPHQLKDYEKHKDTYQSMYKKNHQNKKSKLKEMLKKYTLQEITGIAKAAQSGVLTVNGSHNTTQHNHRHKTGKNRSPKYIHEKPDDLSAKTKSTRDELSSYLPTIQNLKGIIRAHFMASDLAGDAVNLVENFTSFFTTNRGYEEAHAVLYRFVNKANTINLKSGELGNAGYELKSPNFLGFGAETIPLMQKSFLIKSLYEMLFRRYVRSIPPKHKDPAKSKQSPEQVANVKKMSDEIKKISIPYRLHRAYGIAMRVQKNAAKAAGKPYEYKNHSLRDDFEEHTSQSTFSMSTPYS